MIKSNKDSSKGEDKTHTEQEQKEKESQLNKNESEVNEAQTTEEKTELQKAEEKIAELEQQLNEQQDRFLRKAAEFENYKRRSENDAMNLLSYAAESFIIKLLPVVDDFERSLQHISDDNNTQAIREGINLVYEKLLKVLNDQGVKKMESVGKPFNVDYHDALMQRKDDSVPAHTVIEEIETGYLYRDKVIRHAKVIVSEESSADNLTAEEGNEKPGVE
jgi:molecular chaperone GrpE